MKHHAADLPLEVLQQFRVIYGTMRQYFRTIEQCCGLPGSQMWILQEVERTPSIGVTELAQRLGIHQSTCSQLVEKLVARGLLVKERSLEDQRRVGLSLTEVAAELLRKAPGPAEGVLPDALMCLSKETLLLLDASLAEVIGQLGIHDEKYANNPLADM